MRKVCFFLSLVTLLLGTGCTTNSLAAPPPIGAGLDGSPSVPAASQIQGGSRQQLTVFAAASLTGAYQEIGKAFEAANPGVKVSFNFAGSQILRTQLEQGAIADVFASADHRNMDPLVSEQMIADDSTRDFATNYLVVILPKDNPGKVNSISDLAQPGLKLVLADTSVPAGNYARQVLEKIGQDPAYGADFTASVLANVDSNETDVKQVVAKVQLGEADAGIVYFTDAKATPGLVTLAIPPRFNVVVTYPIGVLKGAAEPELAQRFVDYVTSGEGQAILAGWGFSPPGS